MKNNLSEISLNKYLKQVSSENSTPGGGNVLGVVNSLASSLILMAVRIKSDTGVEEKLEKIKEKSLDFAQKDSCKFEKVMEASKNKSDKLPAALQEAAKVSLDTARLSLELLNLIQKLELSEYDNLISDISIAAKLSRVCIKGSLLNCKINLNMLNEKSAAEDINKKREEIEGKFNDISLRLSKKKIWQ
ncbi:MAG: cyclodeaminase/cyclohydrolase family protein [Elusimicrobiota bacterium]